MDKNNNIYSYKTPKSMNEEVHYFLTKGRITIGAFVLRFLFAVLTIAIFYTIYDHYALPKFHEKLVLNDIGEYIIRDVTFKTSFNIFENLTFFIIPSLMGVFIFIQAVKRIHDVNKSGWYILIPLYNIVLLFTKGTKGNNDYGVCPRPQKQVKYFDELEKTKK